MRKYAAASSSSAIPAPGEGKRGAEGHLGYLLRQAGAAHRQAMERALAPLSLTPPQFTVLTMLVAYPGASGADIARLALLTPQTVSVIIANLERAGHVLRRAHAVHGRIVHVDVSDAGRRLLARARGRVQVVERHLAAGLGAGEETAVRRWLARLATVPAPIS